MQNKYKLQLCIIVYSILLLFILFFIFYFQSYSTYFRYGVPSSNQEPLIIISIKIDNYYKYFCLLFGIAIIRIIKVTIVEIADPIISFNVYNPDKKNISEFNKFELQFYTNTLSLIDNLRYVLTIMITISQIDLAIYSVIISEITTIFTVKLLLNQKTFHNNDNDIYNYIV